MPQPFIFRTVDLDGQTIRTAVRPGKPHLTPLLIFNGIGANLELVFPFVEALDPDLEVIAFDVPGRRLVDARHPYRFPGLAKLTARMLDYLDYGQVNVIGVSWGGALAQQFAHDYPERCKKLVLAATAAGAVMVPGKPKVLWMMASPRRYIQPSHVIRIAPMIYGGAFRRDPDLACTTPPRCARRASWATTGSCSPGSAGPASTGCTRSSSRPWYWPATTTR
jgi:poly(3-hydroxyalkanoate) depolymerase